MASPFFLPEMLGIYAALCLFGVVLFYLLREALLGLVWLAWRIFPS